MKKNLMFALLTACLSTGLLATATAAHADTVTINLSSSTEMASAGDTVAFEGTISAPLSNSGDIYINGDNSNLYGPGAVDEANDFDDPLLDNFYTIAPGASQTDEFFDVTIPAGTASGDINGVFLICDVSACNADDGIDLLATLDFTVDVSPATAVTPEPSSWALLATGAFAVIGLTWRQRRATRSPEWHSLEAAHFWS